MRIPVFARRANPSADRPIVKKSESYADAQVAAGLADYVDPKDKRKGIIAREYLASSRVAAAEPGDLPNCFRADGELRGVKFIPPSNDPRLAILARIRAGWDWSTEQIPA